ncbi:hypothetical protein HPB50_015237 [Hyalomma asiaticum]|uniref:Uncharacterized protein n=1 Tax=Hyalomma asiaticum TaxID=266040 RepID=A0ACB7RIX1_HYAAI|nr:hypothetical protein HPB50_015237 [Hyalomma asiaticum]
MLSAADKSCVGGHNRSHGPHTVRAAVLHGRVAGCIAPDPRCFDYAHELALAVAKSGDTDPCDDFYSYVCGNFEDMYPGRSSYLELLKTRLSAYRDHLLDGHSIGKKGEAGSHVILAFRRCVDEYRENHDSSSALRVLLRNAGIEWSPEVLSYTHQDILGVLLRLSLELGVPVLLHAYAGPSLKHADDSNGHIAARVLVTLERLQSRLKTASPWHGGLRYVKFTEVHEQLVKFTEAGQFLSMTNSLLASGPSGAPEDDVVTSTPAQVTSFSYFFAATKPIEMVCMIRYLTVEALLPLSSSRLMDVYDVDRKTAFQVRVRACWRDAMQVMPRAWEHFFYQERLGQRYHALDVMVTSILDSATDQYSWMDQETRQRAEARLRRLRVVLGPPPVQTTHDDAERRNQRTKPPAESMSFVAWLLENRAAYLRTRMDELTSNTPAPLQRT